MRNRDDGTRAARVANDAMDRSLGHAVELGGDLVKEEHVRATHKRTGDGEALSLSPGQIRVCYLGVEPLRKRTDFVVEQHCGERSPRLLVAGTRADGVSAAITSACVTGGGRRSRSEEHVLSHGAGNDRRLLLNVGDPRPDVVDAELGIRHPVEFEVPVARLNEAQQQ